MCLSSPDLDGFTLVTGLPVVLGCGTVDEAGVIGVEGVVRGVGLTGVLETRWKGILIG